MSRRKGGRGRCTLLLHTDACPAHLLLQFTSVLAMLDSCVSTWQGGHLSHVTAVLEMVQAWTHPLSQAQLLDSLTICFCFCGYFCRHLFWHLRPTVLPILLGNGYLFEGVSGYTLCIFLGKCSCHGDSNIELGLTAVEFYICHLLPCNG